VDLVESKMEVEASEIAPLPEAVEVSIPLLSGGEGTAPDPLVALGGGLEASVPSLDLTERLELFPDSISTDASSVFDPGSMWTVQALNERGADVEVSVGRRGDHETSLLLPRRNFAGLEEGSLIAASSETLYQTHGIWGTVKTRVEFRADQSSEPVETEVWLPILRLHCPPRKGCEAEYAVAHAQGDAATFELSVFGLGGGGGQSMTCTVSQVYTAKAQCMEIAVPAKLLLQFGGTYVNDSQVAYGMRATIKEVDAQRQKLRTLPPNHGCGLDYETVKGTALTRMDLTELDGNQGNQEFAVALERETEGKLAVGLELGSAPVKMGFDYVRKTAFETTITTAVSPGGIYTAYPPPAGGGFEVLWTT
jgi:hypothetical protein